MKTHTTAGVELVDSVFEGVEEPHYIEMCKNLVGFHHEWFDVRPIPQKKEYQHEKKENCKVCHSCSNFMPGL